MAKSVKGGRGRGFAPRAAWLRRTRGSLDLKPADFGELLGWHPVTLRKWETARHDSEVPVYVLYAYAGLAGVRVPDALLDPYSLPKGFAGASKLVPEPLGRGEHYERGTVEALRAQSPTKKSKVR